MNVRWEKIGTKLSNNMLKVGITGTIASGKTSVSILLRRRGFSVFNSDNYAKMATHRGNPCFDELVEILGEDSIDVSGDIDRKNMAKIIFDNEDKRKKVNQIVHPYVIEGMEKFFENHQDEKIVFAEVPLLFEAKLEDKFDKIIVVTCNKDTAIKRMIEDRNYSKQEAIARYDSQLSPSYQCERADTIIHNDNDLKDLDTSINLLVRKLRKEARNEKKA